jgi:hypothetical protein
LPPISLFSNTNNARFHTGSLFSNSSASTGLFGSNLFGNNNPPSLFSTSSTGDGLFNPSNPPTGSGIFPSFLSQNSLSAISPPPFPSLFSFQNNIAPQKKIISDEMNTKFTN